MRKKHIAMWTMLGFVIGLAGCTTYYKVSDPSSGHSYYTTKVKERGSSGAIKFEDEKTKSTVTLQASEVKEISEEEFQAGLKAQLKGQAPAPAMAAPASAPAPAPAKAPAPAPAPAPAEASAPAAATPAEVQAQPPTPK